MLTNRSLRFVAVVLLLVVDTVLILGVFTLPRHTWPVFFPLFIYTTFVSFPAMLYFGEDFDILRIRAMIAADLRSVASIFLSMVEQGARYGLKEDEVEHLRKVPNAPTSSIQRVQAVYWRNRRLGKRPSEIQLLIANFVLLLVAAAIGDVVENQLVPDAAAVPPLWSMGPFGLIALLLSTSALFLSVRSFVAFYRSMERWERQSFVTIQSAMRDRPQGATIELLSSLNEEARYKLAEELKDASNYLDYAPRIEKSVSRLHGSAPEGEWRPSGLLSVCLTNFSFGIGLILGAYLPPLLGLAR